MYCERDLVITQVLDLETMQFEPGPTMQQARYGCTATLINAERILVVGGGNRAYLASTELLSV
jgi:hypothetical protein